MLPTLQDYLLYPYLQYEDFRQRRAQVDDLEMAGFLAAHTDWAFRPGLEAAWLRSLARRERWDSLLTYAADASDTEVRCAYAQARIRAGQTDGLLPIAQSLWAVGRSQPEACDPVFRLAAATGRNLTGPGLAADPAGDGGRSAPPEPLPGALSGRSRTGVGRTLVPE